jgi:hypothetical protein
MISRVIPYVFNLYFTGNKLLLVVSSCQPAFSVPKTGLLRNENINWFVVFLSFILFVWRQPAPGRNRDDTGNVIHKRFGTIFPAPCVKNLLQRHAVR